MVSISKDQQRILHQDCTCYDPKGWIIQTYVYIGQIVKNTWLVLIISVGGGGRVAVLEYRYNVTTMCLYWSCSKFKTYTYLSFLGHKVDKLTE